MSPDGSLPPLQQPDALLPPALTIAEVIRRIELDPSVDPRLSRELRSALRKICRVLRLDPTLVPANPGQLRAWLAPITAAAAGVSSSRWANIRSLAFKALKHVGISSMPGRYREPLAPEWEAFRALLPDRCFKTGLSRFMSYCTVHGLAPSDVTPETFTQFGGALETSMTRRPGAVYRDTCKLWNRAVESIPGWPQLSVSVPDRRRVFALPLESFPPGFQANVDRFLSGCANPDVFSDEYCRPVRPLTTKGRKQKILMAATALVKSGVPVQEVTSLSVLVELDNAKAALRELFARKGKKTGYLHHIATLLKTIAKHHVHADKETLESLRQLCSRLNPGGREMTEKNRRFLRQFADPQKLAALFHLPQRLLSDADHVGGERRGEAVKVALGVAIGIELLIPIRIDNLGGLRLDRHIHQEGKRTFLSIPAHETKNNNPINAELTISLAQLLARYLKDYRPRLLDTPCPWLFPGENGRKRSTGFGVQIGKLIAKEIGVTMTPHQFRHLAAKLYLDTHPDGHETVRQLLGHKSIATTMRFYRDLDAVLAVSRYGEMVEQLLASWPTSHGRARS
jgi:integrase